MCSDNFIRLKNHKVLRINIIIPTVQRSGYETTFLIRNSNIAQIASDTPPPNTIDVTINRINVHTPLMIHPLSLVASFKPYLKNRLFSFHAFTNKHSFITFIKKAKDFVTSHILER